MLEIFKRSKSKNPVCWYPSAGYNWEATVHWSQNLGNQLIPKLYIFTDSDYGKASYSSDHLKVVIAHLFQSEDEMERNERILRLNDILSDAPHPHGKIKVETFLVDEDMLKNGFSDSLIVIVLKIKGAHIWLVNTTNERFFQYVIQRRIKIRCGMFYRHMDSFIAETRTLIPALGMKEFLCHPSYSPHHDFVMSSTDMVWQSTYNQESHLQYVNFGRSHENLS